MRLEGTLDAFSLPDIFQLLSFTKKTGTLHLRRGAESDAQHGVVHLRDGAVTGGRRDASRQELGRRLLGAGLADDEVLASAAEELAVDSALGLAQLLAQKGELDADAVRALAAEQATDTVFSLLRWPEGEFAFVMDEPNPDDLGASLSIEQVVGEGQRRLTEWAQLADSVPPPNAVVTVNAAPESAPTATREEWALLSLVDGRRTVADLVTMSGSGEYAAVTVLSGLVTRGLVGVRTSYDDQLIRRQRLLAALEGRRAELETAADEPVAAAPEPTAATQANTGSGLVPSQPLTTVIPERPEPFTAARRPDHPEPAYARAGLGGSGAHGAVDGATALQPGAESVPSSLIERDPSVNKSLLLRLIAGVRGL